MLIHVLVVFGFFYDKIV